MSATADQPFLIIEADVSAPFEPGHIGAGSRRCIPIVGGRVSGAVEGEIIAGGADWQTIHDDGNLAIEAHYAFRTAEGDIVEVLSSGVRAGPPEILARLGAGEAVDSALYYFRTSIRFRTGSQRLAQLNWKLGIARGARRPGGVRLEVFEVL